MSTLSEIVDLASARGLVGRTSLIVVDGPTAAGKTTLVRGLVPLLDAHLVAVDQLSAPGVRPWEWRRFIDEIWTPLAGGHTASYRHHHWTQPNPGETETLQPGRPVILEGVRSSVPEVARIAGLTVFVDTPEATRVDRARTRDPGRFACWTTNWRPIEQEWLATDQPRGLADVVVSGLIPYSW